MNKFVSTIALNVNGVNAPIKRHRAGEWINKYNPHILPTRDSLRNKKTYTDGK